MQSILIEMYMLISRGLTFKQIFLLYKMSQWKGKCHWKWPSACSPLIPQNEKIWEDSFGNNKTCLEMRLVWNYKLRMLMP